MNLTTISVFLSVVDHGSVRRAAEAANRTPSAVSRHVAAIETAIGARLFERRPSGMVLSPEGVALEAFARPLVHKLDLAAAVISDIKGLRAGLIRVSAIEAVVTRLVHPAILAFREIHPTIRIVTEVVSRDNAEVSHALLGGGADVGLMYKMNANSDLDYRFEVPTPFAVIAAPNHPLAHCAQVSMTDLAGIPVAALTATQATRKLFDGVVQAEGVKINYALTVNGFEMAKQFAMTGMGVCLLPAFAIEREKRAGTLVAVPLSEPSLRATRTAVCVPRDRELSPITEKFIETLRRFV